MTFSVHDDSDTAGVVTSGDHANVAGVELDGVHNLVGGHVDADGVVDLDEGVGVADGPAVVGVQHGDGVGADADLDDATQLVLGLLGSDAMNAESALDIVDKPEVLVGLGQLNDIHESGGETSVSPDLAVDLDQALLHDGRDLLHVQSVVQAVPQEKGDRHGFPHLVGA